MNASEFVLFVHPFKDKIFRLAKRLLVSTEEAQDASQEVFLKLWNKKAEIKNWSSAEAMAMTMTRNYCLDQLKSKRSSHVSLMYFDKTDQNNAEKRLDDADSLNWVNKIINQLPNQQKLIIQLREIEEMEFEDIAKILEMNETAVRVALSRARKFVKEKMEKTHSYGTK